MRSTPPHTSSIGVEVRQGGRPHRWLMYVCVCSDSTRAHLIPSHPNALHPPPGTERNPVTPHPKLYWLHRHTLSSTHQIVSLNVLPVLPPQPNSPTGLYSEIEKVLGGGAAQHAAAAHADALDFVAGLVRLDLVFLQV